VENNLAIYKTEAIIIITKDVIEKKRKGRYGPPKH
jgi:hypothetical protein